MKKRLLAGLLTAVLLVSLLPVSAFASEDEQNSGLTAAEQTETTQAAELSEAKPDTQDVPAEAASTESSSVDVTDFSFFAVRTWQSKGYYNEHSESQIQLQENAGEYFVYLPVNGINNQGDNGICVYKLHKIIQVLFLYITLPIVMLTRKTTEYPAKAT